jgi:hypothetical protein
MDNFDFLDIISILSFVIGLMNLDLNQQQVDSLDQHLSMQDEKLLKKIISQNDEILTKMEKIINARTDNI